MIDAYPIFLPLTLFPYLYSEILAKAEWMQPGGSVKDRAAKFCIEAAERSGALKPGGTVVEGTAGNTGIGLAHICAAKGYKCVIFMPNTQSKEKMDTLRMLGAEVHAVPPKPYADDGNYQKMVRTHFHSVLISPPPYVFLT